MRPSPRRRTAKGAPLPRPRFPAELLGNGKLAFLSDRGGRQVLDSGIVSCHGPVGKSYHRSDSRPSAVMKIQLESNLWLSLYATGLPRPHVLNGALVFRPAGDAPRPARRYWFTTTSAGRCRSSYLPKIMRPAVVWSTLVTAMSMVFEIILRALSTTTIVPSSR